VAQLLRAESEGRLEERLGYFAKPKLLINEPVPRSIAGVGKRS
jgi:hypothetical protein